MGLYANSLAEVVCRAVNDQYQLPIPMHVSKGISVVNVQDLGNGRVQGEVNGARNSGWRGYKTVIWHKLDVTHLFDKTTPKIQVATASTSLDLVTAISAQLGVPLTANDIVSHDVDHPANGSDPQCIIEIKDSHLWLKGFFIVDITSIHPDLSVLVIGKDLEVVPDYPTGLVSNVASFSYGWDYTEVGQQLLDYTAGVTLSVTQAESLAAALRGCDGRIWTASSTPLPFNLLGATVISNAVVTGVVPGPNPAYERCLVLKPNATYWPNSANLTTGFELYLHYDDFGGR